MDACWVLNGGGAAASDLMGGDTHRPDATFLDVALGCDCSCHGGGGVTKDLEKGRRNPSRKLARNKAFNGPSGRPNRVADRVCAALLPPLLEWCDEGAKGVGEAKETPVPLKGRGPPSPTVGGLVGGQLCRRLAWVSQKCSGSGCCRCRGRVKWPSGVGALASSRSRSRYCLLACLPLSFRRSETAAASVLLARSLGFATRPMAAEEQLLKGGRCGLANKMGDDESAVRRAAEPCFTEWSARRDGPDDGALTGRMEKSGGRLVFVYLEHSTDEGGQQFRGGGPSPGVGPGPLVVTNGSDNNLMMSVCTPRHSQLAGRLNQWQR